MVFQLAARLTTPTLSAFFIRPSSNLANLVISNAERNLAGNFHALHIGLYPNAGTGWLCGHGRLIHPRRRNKAIAHGYCVADNCAIFGCLCGWILAAASARGPSQDRPAPPAAM